MAARRCPTGGVGRSTTPGRSTGCGRAIPGSRRHRVRDRLRHEDRRRRKGPSAKAAAPHASATAILSRLVRSLRSAASLTTVPATSSPTGTREGIAARRVSSLATQGGQTARLAAALVTPQSPRRAAEGPRDIVLIGPALLDQAGHVARFGYAVADDVMGQRYPGNHYQPVAVTSADHAPIVDRHRRIRRSWQGKSALCSLAANMPKLDAGRPENRTGLDPHSRRKVFLCLQRLTGCYVRRSGLMGWTVVSGGIGGHQMLC